MRTARRRGAHGRRALWAWVVLAGIVLAACSQNVEEDPLNPAGPNARRIDELFMPVFWIAVGVFVVVEGLILFAAIRFRRRPGRGDPVQVHGNTRLEIMWTVLPALVLAVIAVPTIRGIFDLARQPASDAVEVRVIGHQWWWEFQYPELNVVTANELHIPVGRPVDLSLEAGAIDGGQVEPPPIPVIHSFWVPRLGGKQDVVPGRRNPLTLEADEPGIYPGQCAEYCGLSHANMRFRVIAQTEADFEEWVDAQRAPVAAPPPAGSLEEEGAKLFQSFQTGTGGGSCLACHSLRGVEGGRAGPDLTLFGRRTTLAAGLLDNTPAQLARWLRNPPGVKPGAKMPDYGLSERQIEALVAYLRSLR